MNGDCDCSAERDRWTDALLAEVEDLRARLAAAERELDAERAAGAALAGRLGEVQAKADCAERDRDEFDRQRKLYHSDMMAVREQRDAAERRAEEAERERDEARQWSSEQQIRWRSAEAGLTAERSARSEAAEVLRRVLDRLEEVPIAMSGVDADRAAQVLKTTDRARAEVAALLAKYPS